jgi:hypothetical protein
MSEETRVILESPIYQGVDERIAYRLTTTPWGSSPSSPSVVIKNAAGTDVTATYTTGSASAAGDVITTPTIHGLVANTWYRLEIKFTISGNVLEAWSELIGQA